MSKILLPGWIQFVSLFVHKRVIAAITGMLGDEIVSTLNLPASDLIEKAEIHDLREILDELKISELLIGHTLSFLHSRRTMYLWTFAWKLHAI